MVNSSFSEKKRYDEVVNECDVCYLTALLAENVT